MTLVSELNPTERLRQHTRKSETHNRFFESLGALLATMMRVLAEMQSHPQQIYSYLAPLADHGRFPRQAFLLVPGLTCALMQSEAPFQYLVIIAILIASPKPRSRRFLRKLRMSGCRASTSRHSTKDRQ
jgi:hypothetical protein